METFRSYDVTQAEAAVRSKLVKDVQLGFEIIKISTSLVPIETNEIIIQILSQFYIKKYNEFLLTHPFAALFRNSLFRPHGQLILTTSLNAIIMH